MRGKARPIGAGDFAVLAFLMRRPRTAYELSKAITVSMADFWDAGQSQVYQQTARLIRDGYIREGPAGDGRGSRILRPTPKGRRAALAWLAETSAPLPEIKSDVLVRIFFGDLVDDASVTQTQIENQIATVRRRLDLYDAMRRAMESRGGLEWELMTLTVSTGMLRGALAALESLLNRPHRRVSR